jgi:GTP-binding protein Era
MVQRKTRSGRIALLGRPNVGKSTLLNALVGEPVAIVSPHPQTTRDAVRGIATVGDTQYVFVDTPGLHAAHTKLGERMNRTARDEAHEADALVLVVEAPHARQRAEPDGKAPHARQRAEPSDKAPHARQRAEPSDKAPHVSEADLALARGLGALPAVLTLSKTDRLGDKRLLLPVIEAFSTAHPFAAIVPISAKRGDALDRLLRELRELLPEQPFLFEPDTLSDQPVRFFVAEFVREQILRHTRQEVPHGVAVVVERFDEGAGGEKPARIDLAVHVAREAHKKILIGAQGRMMKTIGTAARERVEKMLGKRVHLGLWVRITPDWMNDPAKLQELGYGGASGSGDEG